MLQRIYEAVGFVFLAIVLALSARPSIAPATPVQPSPSNVTPPNPAGNEAALRAEISILDSKLKSAKAELQSLRAAKVPTAAPVASPAHVAVTEGEAVAATGCAGGNCAVPRARSKSMGHTHTFSQAVSEGPRFQRRERRAILPWRR